MITDLLTFSLPQQKELADHLCNFITDHKRSLFEKIIENRTRHITVVLEDLYQMHNASAVMRTCDCFGIQDIHIIENKNKHELNNEISLGSEKWITLHKYKQQENNTIQCLQSLKEKGYKIVATTPHRDDCLLDELPVDDKLALVFGTELEGLTNDVMDHADLFMRIPMYGFTESFNISVSAAITLHTLTEKLHRSAIPWQLSEAEKTFLTIQWACSVIKKPDLIISDYIQYNF